MSMLWWWKELPENQWTGEHYWARSRCNIPRLTSSSFTMQLILWCRQESTNSIFCGYYKRSSWNSEESLASAHFIKSIISFGRMSTHLLQEFRLLFLDRESTIVTTEKTERLRWNWNWCKKTKGVTIFFIFYEVRLCFNKVMQRCHHATNTVYAL